MPSIIVRRDVRAVRIYVATWLGEPTDLLFLRDPEGDKDREQRKLERLGITREPSERSNLDPQLWPDTQIVTRGDEVRRRRRFGRI